jgi:hypothetical protein
VPVSIYVIVARPALTPVTLPGLEGTEATDVLLLVHRPPDVILVSEVMAPSQIVDVPAIGAGNGFTFIVVVLMQPDPIL